MDSRAVVLLVTLLAHSFGGCRSEYSSSALSTHIDLLLAEYDREVPPQASTRVELSLDVRHAAVLDASATMRLLADLKMVWTDDRLAWNGTAWEGDSAPVPAARLWTPDVQLVSAGVVREGGAGEGGLRARVSSGGAVTRVLRLDLAVPVQLQVAHWPQDTQQADFKFASRAHSSDELELVIGDYKGSVVVECGAWEVEGVAGAAVEWRGAPGGAAAGRAAAWSVRATRRGAAAALQHGAVLAAATLLLAASAAPPRARRAPLALCASLIASLWLITVMWTVPPAASAPRIVSLMCAVCALGAGAGAGAALAGRVARRTAPPPRALRTLLSRMSRVLPVAPDTEGVGQMEGGAGEWMAMARLLDALLAALLMLALLVLLVVYLLF